MTDSEVKLFAKWTFDDVEVNDISLEDYIAVSNAPFGWSSSLAG